MPIPQDRKNVASDQGIPGSNRTLIKHPKAVLLVISLIFGSVILAFQQEQIKLWSNPENIVQQKIQLVKHNIARQHLPLIGRWNLLIEPNKNSDKKGFLFVKHVRKAGGTSMRTYLERVLCYHADNCTNPIKYSERVKTENMMEHAIYYDQEFRSMHWKCPQLDEERWNRTISVTVLRHPIERHLSEFFYSGKPSIELRRMERSKNFSKEFFTSLELEIIPWIKHGNEVIASTNKKYHHMEQYFLNEYQVRAFGGETHDHPTNETDRPPCSYGGGFGGGANPDIEVNHKALFHAKNALRQFDVVLLTETMSSNPENVAMLSDVLDYPFNNSEIPRKNFVDGAGVKSAMLRAMEIHSPGLLVIFENYTKFEMPLYEYAVEINQALLGQWRYEKSIILANGGVDR